jgi:hypothetical protein
MPLRRYFVLPSAVMSTCGVVSTEWIITVCQAHCACVPQRDTQRIDLIDEVYMDITTHSVSAQQPWLLSGQTQTYWHWHQLVVSLLCYICYHDNIWPWV